MGTLYIVATPIGNLEDMTFRALRILKEVTLIAAEDTRTSRVLTQHFEIDTPMTSYHEHNKVAKLEQIFNTLVTGDVALISDAGTPGISDPGYELINEAINREIPVVPLPGANAIIPALVASGLPTDGFLYLGFLPKKEKAIRDLLTSVKDEKRTLVAYESPYRLTDSLEIAADVLGDRLCCVAREISKKFEEFHRNSLSGALAYFSDENPRGEVTLVIRGAEAESEWDEDRVRVAFQQKLQAGESRSKAAKAIAAQSGWKKSDIYSLDI